MSNPKDAMDVDQKEEENPDANGTPNLNNAADFLSAELIQRLESSMKTPDEEFSIKIQKRSYGEVDGPVKVDIAHPQKMICTWDNRSEANYHNFPGGRGDSSKGTQTDNNNFWSPPPSPPPEKDDLGNLRLKDIGGLGQIISALDASVLTPFINCGIEGNGKCEIPKGFILHGPPGTGKTLLARTLTVFLRERMGKKITYLPVKGSELFDKYVGETEKKLRRLFGKASKYKPSIIFFDEFDALCPSRKGANDDNLGHFRTSVVDTLLGTLDEVIPGDVLIIGATNLLDSIDPAIRRPGRFDHIYNVPLPNELGRYEIFNIHSNVCNPKPSEEQLKELARTSGGFTGADIQSVCLKVKKIARERMPIPAGIVRYSKEYYEWRKRTTLKVSWQDWLDAIDSTSPSAVGCFGSAIYSPRTPSAEEQRIFSPLIAGVKSTLREFCIHGDKGLHTFYLWGSSSRLTTLNHRIVPELTSKMEGGHMASYLINIEKLSCRTRTPMTIFRSIMDELALSGKSGILIIHDLQEIIESFQRQGINPDVFASQLMDLEGRKTIILGTSSTPIKDIGSPGLRRLFSGRHSFELKAPQAADRKRIFQNILVEGKVAGISPEDEATTIDRLVQRDFGRIAGDDFEVLLRIKKHIATKLRAQSPKDIRAVEVVIEEALMN